MEKTLLNKPNGRLIIILAIATALLLVPFVGMLFTKEVKWTLSDFVVAAVLLYGTAFLFELIMRKIRTTKYRVIAFIILFVSLILIWAELAVGVFGTPFAGS